jgi:hypothetical protein
MMLSISFIILDCLSVTNVINDGLPDGLNPFWKLAFVFKCFTDTIILDDFKTALDKLKVYKLGRISGSSGGAGGAGAADSKASAGDSEPAVSPHQRHTEYAPWNESRGVTSDDRPIAHLTAVDEVDLESQLKYWERQDGSTSTAIR